MSCDVGLLEQCAVKVVSCDVGLGEQCTLKAVSCDVSLVEQCTVIAVSSDVGLVEQYAVKVVSCDVGLREQWNVKAVCCDVGLAEHCAVKAVSCDIGLVEQCTETAVSCDVGLVEHFAEMRSYPMSKVRGGSCECQTVTAQEQPREDTHIRGQGQRPGRATPCTRPGRRPRGAIPGPMSSGCAGTGGLRGATPHSRSGAAVVRRCPSSKVRSSSCALLEQP